MYVKYIKSWYNDGINAVMEHESFTLCEKAKRMNFLYSFQYYFLYGNVSK